MSMRSLIWFAFAFAIFGMASSSCHAKSICENPTILPGNELGSLKLGMSVDEAMQVVGKPDLDEQTGKFGGSEWRKLYYYPGSDFALIAQDGRIVELFVGAGSQDTQSCSTSEGIRIGSRKVKKVYGDSDDRPDRRAVIAYWTYDKKGISFTLDSEGGVLFIDIFTPGRYGALRERKKALGW